MIIYPRRKWWLFGARGFLAGFKEDGRWFVKWFPTKAEANDWMPE